MMDKAGNKAAQQEIAMVKVAAPTMALQILDDAIQAHGGGGVSQDFGLAHAWAAMRTLRFADGPDEVHNRAIARHEFGKYADLPDAVAARSEEHTSELQSLMRISYAVFCLKKKITYSTNNECNHRNKLHVTNETSQPH